MSTSAQLVQFAPESSAIEPDELERQHVLIDRLDAAIRTALPCIDLEEDMPPVHHFADGLYARTMVVPEGTLMVGMIHRRGHIAILSQGRISVWAPGDVVRHYEAPHIITAPAGARRIGYAHSNVIWTTVHAAEARDVEGAELEVLEYRPQLESATTEDIEELHRVISLLNAELLPPTHDDERTMSLEGGTE